MAKHIIYSNASREALKAGVDKLADAVKVTIGPKGRNVIIRKEVGAPLITNDGVSIAKEIELEDPFEDMGAQLVKEVATKTNDVAGDGTTTATILTQAMMANGIEALENGANPVLLRAGMQKAVDYAVNKLKEQAKIIDNNEEIAQVATISSADPKIGELIAEAMDVIGRDGTIALEESKTMDTTLTTAEGMQIDRGFISTHMATDTEKLQSEMTNPYVLITDRKINVFAEILPLIEQIIQSQRPLLIIAEDVEGETLSTLVVNKLRGVLDVAAIKAPGFGNRRKALLEDIAILTGATVVSEEIGLSLSEVRLEHLGACTSVKITKDDTVIAGGNGSKESIAERVETIKAELNDANTSGYDKEKLQERLAKLTGGVAVIKVGAATEIEMKEKKLRIEDALNATKAAVEEGIVAGGGTALASLSDDVIAFAKTLEDEDEKAGAKLIGQSLIAPLIQIAFNAGVDAVNVLLESDKLREESNNMSMGYDALKGNYVNMIDEGIIDPVKVTRSALQNSASIVGVFLTTECAIV